MEKEKEGEPRRTDLTVPTFDEEAPTRPPDLAVRSPSLSSTSTAPNSSTKSVKFRHFSKGRRLTVFETVGPFWEGKGREEGRR